MSFRLLVFLFLSPLLFRLIDGFDWHWVFIMVWSEMKGVSNINLALLFAYSDFPFGTEKEKSQVKTHSFFFLIWIFNQNCCCIEMCFRSEVAQRHLDYGGDLVMMARSGRGRKTGNFPLPCSSFGVPKSLPLTPEKRLFWRLKELKLINLLK